MNTQREQGVPNEKSRNEARGKVIERLERMLVGPGLGIPSDDGSYECERIEGRLSLAYMLAMLYPRQSGEDNVLGGDDEGEGDGDAVAEVNDPLGMANTLLPASMGISFCLQDGAAVELTVTAAHYCRDPDAAKEEWVRVQLGPDKISLSADQDISEKKVLGGMAILSVLTRQVEQKSWLVTASLSNATEESRPRDSSNNLYQVGIQIDRKTGRIQEYPTSDYAPPSEEERELRVIYGAQKTFAAGHGVSSDWTLDASGDCTAVRTQPLPRTHVWRPLFDRLEIGEGAGRETFEDTDLFIVACLASDEVDRSMLVSRLHSFINFYEKWVTSQRELDSPEGLELDAERIVERCERSATRMRDGVSLLASDDVALKSFVLANRAMLMSMCHYQRTSGASRDDGMQGPFELGQAETSSIDYFANTKAKWRPFQIAYLLQLMPSLCNDAHEDRDVVDVLWFATGGGKTEAYLLAAAFELVRRRLVLGTSGIGTGVINRYTYRFLTSDQFQRTAGMICALELMRRGLAEGGDESLGADEFSIGLFAGGTVSPNRFSSGDGGAHQLRLKVEEAEEPQAENPFPIESCPSCGTKLVPEKAKRLPDGSVDRAFYGFESSANSFSIRCPDEDCDFTDGIPAYIVDEQIYQKPPSFLLGTIDKFAMIPWQEKGGRIFGAGVGIEPPSLIIQDELHLISGPLGTITGIYEAAFETLSKTISGSSPKVIAATATIRNAAMQCQRIFGRTGVVFPSPGMRSDDSFFSRLDVENVERSRLYIGLMGQGITSTVAVSWGMAAILQSVQELDLGGKLTPEELDSYWTLVAYHNSKRELGRISNATRDEIPARLKVYAKTEESERPSNFDVLELKAHSETPVPVARQMLRRKHTADNPSVDIVPCTNIISVGVDIERLGLMLVNGQPKLTAEYIQASSRVGRGEIPGLVVTCYSPSKPRDRSHYEAFRDFHERFYSFVEPTSVTPGSLPALERALHAALILTVRHGAGLVSNSAASKFDPSNPQISKIVSLLKSRLMRAYDEENDALVRSRIAKNLDLRCQQWLDWANKDADLAYRAAHNQALPVLMTPFGTKRYQNVGWFTLQSMRHVDTEILLET
jgi:hypothetical protein